MQTGERVEARRRTNIRLVRAFGLILMLVACFIGGWLIGNSEGYSDGYTDGYTDGLSDSPDGEFIIKDGKIYRLLENTK